MWGECGGVGCEGNFEVISNPFSLFKHSLVVLSACFVCE